MLLNIIDRRKQPYRFKKVNAVIEPTRHDNKVKGADRAPRSPKMDNLWIGCDDQEHVSLLDAVVWASMHPDHVTLYLYDPNDGLYDKRKRKHSR